MFHNRFIFIEFLWLLHQNYTSISFIWMNSKSWHSTNVYSDVTWIINGEMCLTQSYVFKLIQTIKKHIYLLIFARHYFAQWSYHQLLLFRWFCVKKQHHENSLLLWRKTGSLYYHIIWILTGRVKHIFEYWLMYFWYGRYIALKFVIIHKYFDH